MHPQKYYSIFATHDNSEKLYNIGCRYLEEWKNKYVFKDGTIQSFTILDLMVPENAACIWIDQWKEKSVEYMQMWQRGEDWETKLMKEIV